MEIAYVISAIDTSTDWRYYPRHTPARDTYKCITYTQVKQYDLLSYDEIVLLSCSVIYINESLSSIFYAMKPT